MNEIQGWVGRVGRGSAGKRVFAAAAAALAGKTSCQELLVLFPASAREYVYRRTAAYALLAPRACALARALKHGCSIDAWEPDGFLRRGEVGDPRRRARMIDGDKRT